MPILYFVLFLSFTTGICLILVNNSVRFILVFVLVKHSSFVGRLQLQVLLFFNLFTIV